MSITHNSSIRLSAIAAASLLALALVGCNNASTESTEAADTQTTNQASNDMASAASSDSQTADNSSEYASADDIRKGIVGYTITGKMSSGTQYGEYYAEDGSIEAADYTAKWQIKDSKLCWDYGDDKPLDCYDVKINGQDVTWYKDGEIKGSGTAVPGDSIKS